MASIAETMFAPCRHDYGLTCRQWRALVTNPELGLPLQYSQNFFDGMHMSGCTFVWLTPLLELAKLHGTRDGRDTHARQHAGTPLFIRLVFMINDLHMASQKSCAHCFGVGTAERRRSQPQAGFRSVCSRVASRMFLSNRLH